MFENTKGLKVAKIGGRWARELCAVSEWPACAPFPKAMRPFVNGLVRDGRGNSVAEVEDERGAGP